MFLGSQLLFRLTVVLLIVQASWIALSGRFPMAFDEDFHFGIIKLYAHHPSPFWSAQPENADVFGAVARDPSYLYHWLMSFPYRLIDVFTHDQTVQVLLLRAINIGLFVLGLLLIRQLLLRTGASRAAVQSCLLIFVLLPIVPLLAAQINYDNLLVPVVAGILLLSIDFFNELRSYGRINTKRLLTILIACLLASLIKYAFLPIFLAIFGFLLLAALRKLKTVRELIMTMYFGWSLIGRGGRWLLIGLLLISSGLFLQRYGVNMAQYHKPVPDCSQVLNVQRCSAYGPWIRDYMFENNKPGGFAKHPVAFNFEWFYGMWFRTFFAVDGPSTQFETRGPLLLPAISGLVFLGAGAIAVGLAFKRVLRRYDTSVIALLGSVTIVYVVVLWLDEYEAYLRTGQPVAINGRYLLPVLPFMLLAVSLAFQELLKRRREAKLAILTAAILSLLWGGGALTYVLRGRDAWYWPNSGSARINRSIQQVLGPLTPGYSSPTLFLR
jgi:hypothetical protein